jgi:hypothetical protein
MKWKSTEVSGSRDGLVLGGTGRIYGALADDFWGLDPSGTSAWHVAPDSDTTSRGAPLVRGAGIDVLDLSVVDFSSGSPSSHIKELCGADGSSACAVHTFKPVTGANFGTAPAFSDSANRMVVADDTSCGFYVLDGYGGEPLGHPITGVSGNMLSCPFVELALGDGVMAAAGLQGSAIYAWADGGLNYEGDVGSGTWYAAGTAIFGSTAWITAGSQLIGVDGASSPPTAIATVSPGGTLTAPVIDDRGNLYVASTNGSLCKLDSSGGLVWSLALGSDGYLPGSPTIGADGILYLVDGSEALDAVDPQGHLLWTTGPQFAAPIGSPMIDPCTRTLYVTTADHAGVAAVVVDSAGLDATGDAWPVYRHDYFGTADAKSHRTLDCSGHL